MYTVLARFPRDIFLVALYTNVIYAEEILATTLDYRIFRSHVRALLTKNTQIVFPTQAR